MKRHKILNRKSLKISFAVFWTGFLIFFGWFYLAKIPPVANAGSGNNPAVAIAGNVTLIADEVAKHNSPSDCWLIISGSVYNVTNFLGVHPGGPGAITPYCGKDATTAFATKNQGTPHSSTAISLLNSYYLGKVGETISGTAVQSVQNQPVPNISGEKENEND